jgi:glycosyltransferase involved in cell wall biosynthesis
VDQVVAYLPAWIDACALYRMFLPHLHTPNSKFVFHPQATPFKEFEQAKVAVVQRQCTRQNFEALKKMKSMGLKLVYDLDDNVWNLPSHNPAKEVFEQMRQGFSICANVCDLVTVSTEALRGAVKVHAPEIAKKVEVVNNGIDFTLFQVPKIPKSDNGMVTIGWAGSNTHSGDLAEVWSLLPELHKEYENVAFEIVGEKPPEGWDENTPRLHNRRWIPTSMFPARWGTWGWDIVLAPLQDNQFNRSKSNIKMLEAAAVNAPCLVSEVRPYQDFCEHDSELKFLLCANRHQWKKKLRELVNETEKRKYLATKMRAVAEKYFTIQTTVKRWIEVTEQVSHVPSAA